MTQEDVALAAGTDAGYLSRIERGNRVPSLELLVSVASALGTTVSSLCAVAEGLEQPPPMPQEFQANFCTDFSDDAIQMRQIFRELTKDNQRVAVELLRALKRTQS